MKSISKQNGNTLLMGMIMLILLSLMAISAITSTDTSVQMVGNAQFREEAVTAAQQAIDNVISSSAFMTTTPSQNIDINRDGNTDYTVTFTPAPICKTFQEVDTTQTGLPKECYGSVGGLCYWAIWDVTAVISDAKTGTSITLHQGIRTITGLNAALISCGV